MRPIFGFAILIVAATAALRTSAQSDAAYRNARRVLEAAQAAHGAETLPGFDRISWKLTGKLYARNQSPKSDENRGEPFSGQMQWDIAANRFVWEAASSFPGGFTFHNRTIVQNDRATIVDLQRGVVNPPPPGPPLTGIPLRDGVTFRIPHVLLARALSRAASLRAGADVTIDGTIHHVVTFALETGQVQTLYFDARTKLLKRYDTVLSDPILGDTTAATTINGYQVVNGFQLPVSHVQTVGPEVFQEYQYSDFRIDPELPDSSFDLTAFKPLPTAAATPLAAKALAKDVYLVQGLGGGTHSAMFVAFRDHVVVLEAPLNEVASRQVMAKVAETAPGKPIRYVVLTHHHWDHVGGIRTYMAEGATIVTTPGNVAYLNRIARAPFTIAGDALQRSAREPIIEVVHNGRRVFDDGDRQLELRDVGPNSHAAEMLVAWMPSERLLFVGDLLARFPEGSVAPAVDSQADFAAKLHRLGWPVERIVDVHSLVNTIDDLKRSVALRETNRDR